MKIIDPESNLHDLLIFRIIFFVGIILAMIITCQVWPFAPEVITDHEAINKVAFDILKTPFSIIAVTISLLLIIGTMHRSAQTVKQIKISINQIDTANYYKHLDEFRMFIDSSHLLNIEYEKKSMKLIHDEFWPNYLNSNYNMDIQILNQFEEKSKEIFNILIKEDRTFEDYTNWIDALNSIKKLFDFKRFPARKEDENMYIDLYFSTFLHDTCLVFEKAIEVCSFEVKIESRLKLKEAKLISECRSFDSPAVNDWLRSQK